MTTTQQIKPSEREVLDRRGCIAAAVSTAVSVFLPIAKPASAGTGDAWRALQVGGVVALFRHARAPGTGDPPGFRLDACDTQRNLSERGRSESRRIGDEFRQRGIRAEVALHSRWCRARDTAVLAFPQIARAEPFLDSFFSDRARQVDQTDWLRRFVAEWAGPRGVAVLVTHQVNITALTGIVPREAEALVLRADHGREEFIGRLSFLEQASLP